jgi:magnesium chelatase subunit D
LDLNATLCAATMRQVASGRSPGSLRLTAEDLYVQRLFQLQQRLVVFVVDTSDSMGDGPAERMSAALGAILSLATYAYLDRERVCLITFRQQQAELVVPPTSSVLRIRRQLGRLPVGGATPLAAGLTKAREIIQQERRKDFRLQPLLVLVSDGEATAALRQGADLAQEALSLARLLCRDGVRALLIDTLPDHLPRALMPALAKAFGTESHRLKQLRNGQLIRLIKDTFLDAHNDDTRHFDH